jgi:hypothetical protein
LFTSEQLKLIIQLANNVEVKGIDAMNAVVGLAVKCGQMLEAGKDSDKEPPAPAPE